MLSRVISGWPRIRRVGAGVALSYALCTLAWAVAQGPFLGFMNNLFHGMDFTPLMKDAVFSWGGFIEARLVMTVWALLAGTFFKWLRHRLGS